VPPLLHTVALFLVSYLGGLAGAFLGVVTYSWGGRALIGHHAGVPPFLFGMIAFGVVFYFWERFVPIRCTQCGGRMNKKYKLAWRGVFSCAACGWQR
jgi:hypothetical protein